MGKKTAASKHKDHQKNRRDSNQGDSVEKVRPNKKVDDAPEVEKVSLITHPVKTLQLFSRVLFKLLQQLGGFVAKHSIPISVLATVIVLAHIIHGPHTPLVKQLDQFAEFCAYWIILGVASSIGLGTGLHTFVLYLGPHIAKVTMVANECNAIPEYLPSRWAIRPTFGECPAGEREQISFFTILAAVQIESFLWGLGTALGELPPYFVARAASLAGKTSEELEDIEKTGAASLLDKAKLIIYKNLQRYGFLTVLVCASIPNPLFDLAGITCGHFGIPFATFFGATAIGKAIIKVHIQMLFVIFMFTGHHVETVLNLVERNIPFLKGTLSNMLDKQKKLLHSPPDAIKDEKPLVAQLWDYFIFLMILFFIISTIQSLANQELEEENQRKSGNQNKNKKEAPKAVKEQPKKEEKPVKEQPVEQPVEEKKPVKEEKPVKPAKNEKSGKNAKQQEQPAKTEKKAEQPAKVEQPAKTQQPAKVEQPAKNEKSGKNQKKKNK